MYVKVKDEAGLARDSVGAILSVDSAALDGYKKRKTAASAIQSAVEDINTLKEEMNEIKQLLVRALNRGETL
jgi:hypothetical protein